ncbi:hypothetical protein [Pandoraea horticolens]|nr:hypothetical protein [Pandoraea horticolens]
MLRQWAVLGQAGIQGVGRLDGLARRDNVSVVALKNYFRADGTLTPRGEDRLNRGGKAEITDTMLRQWAALGQAGIKAAGGLDGLAWRNNVSVAALRTFLHVDGRLTQRGEDRLNPREKVEITVAMLRQWAALGPTGIKAAGRLDGLARRYNVSVAALKNYLRADGTLTQFGEERLNPGGTVEITGTMLRQWVALGRAGVEAAGGLEGLARRNNVSVAVLRTYLHVDSRLTQRGEDRLNPGRKVEITVAMLRQWAALGQAGIKAAGGLDGLARRDNVSVAALKNYLRADGTLTQFGEDRLNPGGTVEITDTMLRQWAALGPEEIKAAGGLDGLARRDNISSVALKGYLRADGRLTPRGEDRLNPGGKAEITDAMLRQWAALGKTGIKAAGGLDSLARRYNVSVAALKSYLRADGTLSLRGENRLRKAGTPPM